TLHSLRYAERGIDCPSYQRAPHRGRGVGPSVRGIVQSPTSNHPHLHSNKSECSNAESNGTCGFVEDSFSSSQPFSPFCSWVTSSCMKPGHFRPAGQVLTVRSGSSRLLEFCP